VGRVRVEERAEMTESRTLVCNVCLERQSSLLTIELSVFSTVTRNCLIIDYILISIQRRAPERLNTFKLFVTNNWSSMTGGLKKRCVFILSLLHCGRV
jgi:hypothetical protein